MPVNPVIKLKVDLRILGRFFPLNDKLPGGFEYYLKIDQRRHDEIQGLLTDYDVSAGGITHDLCFIVLWIEKEIEAIDGQDTHVKEFRQMWDELDGLKEYLLKYRVTSVKFEGESERDLPGQSFTLKEMSNIDRLCDGIRSIYKDEFHHDREKRKARGRRAWMRRRMEVVKNKILNWMTTVPELDLLELEEQNDIIDKLAQLAGLPE